ncbi:kinase-like domain-containing protein [Gaertneriomyces semiglobifer]|nr:kinase-like domain-containing protein [Gaertneriomyces semiglobifer]
MSWADCTLQDILHERKLLFEAEAKEAVFGMLEAIACVHYSQLVHRDIKPANIMMMKKDDFSTVKLADFGVAVGNVGYENLNQRAGTLGFEAPEMLAGRFYSRAVDLWSAGVVCYQLLYGCLPFKATSSGGLFSTKKIGAKQQLDAIKKGLVFQPAPIISPLAKDFITKLLHYDPQHRMTAEQALDHPWFSDDIPSLTPGSSQYSSASSESSTPLPPLPPRKSLDGAGLADVASKLIERKAEEQVGGEGSQTKRDQDEEAVKKKKRRGIPVAGYPQYFSVQTEDGKVYYFNSITKQTSWQHPSQLDGSTKAASDEAAPPTSRRSSFDRSPDSLKGKRVQFRELATDIVSAISASAQALPPMLSKSPNKQRLAPPSPILRDRTPSPSRPVSPMVSFGTAAAAAEADMPRLPPRPARGKTTEVVDSTRLLPSEPVRSMTSAAVKPIGGRRSPRPLPKPPASPSSKKDEESTSDGETSRGGGVKALAAKFEQVRV